MARLTKAQQALRKKRDQKRKERARKKDEGLVELHMEVEHPTRKLINQVSSLTGQTPSDLMVDMLSKYRGVDLIRSGIDLLARKPKWTTPEPNPVDLHVLIPIAAKETLTAHPKLSAGSIVEVLLLERLVLIRPHQIGIPDSLGNTLFGDELGSFWEDDLDLEGGELRRARLAYVHEGVVIWTDMEHLIDGFGGWDKYESRVERGIQGRKSRQAREAGERPDESHLIALHDYRMWELMEPLPFHERIDRMRAELS